MALVNDQGLTNDLSIPVPVELVVASTSVLEAQIPYVLIALEEVKTIIPILAP